MLFLLNYREYYDNLCDEPELSLCNSDQEMSEIVLILHLRLLMMIVIHRHFMRLIVIVITKMSLELTNIIWQMKSGFKRVHVEYVDPVVQKLQSFLNSGVLPTESMFYILLKNAVSYVDCLV